MASSIDISSYTIPVEISTSNDTFIAVQVSSDSALDADVTVSLQHATDNQLIDIADTSTLLASGENTVLIETFDFTLQTLYLKVDVGSATVGTLSISTSTKKKVDSGEVDATITGDVNIVNGVQSSLNTTTTLLTAASTYTGTFEQNDYPEVLIQANTDQNGTLYVDFSPDGVNVDTTLTFFYNTERINPPHVFVKANRYVRVRFENTSTSDQTYLRLYTYYGSYKDLTAPINGTLSENFDAVVVRPTDFHYEVAMSKRQGNATVNKFGYNPDIDTSGGDEIIASFGGALDVNFSIMTTADTIDFVSTSASDTSAGVGAQSLIVTGIDENYLSVTEILTMNGTTAVTTVNNYLGLNRVVVYNSGTSRTNVGTITGTDTGASFGTQAEIPIGNSVTQQCIYHTQINHSLLADWVFLNGLKISGGSSPRLRFKAFSYSRVTNTIYQVFRHDQDTAVENTLTMNPSQPFLIGGREVLFFTCSTTSNNTEVDARFSGIEQRVS